MSSRDPNYNSLPVPNRFDFLVYRVDETIVRMHPESKQHGKIVKGDLSDWII